MVVTKAAVSPTDSTTASAIAGRVVESSLRGRRGCPRV
jgi:hypothetical protein